MFASRHIVVVLLLHRRASLAFHLAPVLSHCELQATKDSWSAADDWASLSSSSQENSSYDTSKLFNQHPMDRVAKELEAQIGMEMEEASSEEMWLSDAMDAIQHASASMEDNLYDTSFEEEDFSATASSEEIMEQEITMLVRCNESPEDLLIDEGRAIAPLTDEEKDDPFQLVTYSIRGNFQPTKFLEDSLDKIFNEHARPHELDGVLSLDRKGIARWMTKSLSSEKDEGIVGAHDKRVLTTLSQFSRYGSGRLIKEDFQSLYLTAIVGDATNVGGSKGVQPKRHLKFRQANIDAVWRDIRNHRILSPVEEKRRQLMEQIEQHVAPKSDVAAVDGNTVMDECEILDFNWDATRDKDSKIEKRQATGSWSSHEGVERAKDNKTPLRMSDGEFVFIDEDSCIGCMQCVNAAPSCFMMLDSGRARTFNQRSSTEVDQAVASCPVDCMHSVTYRELKELETVRDHGDGRSDHSYLGQKLVPLHVVESDHNRRSSWYHTLKHKCLVSSQCPQKGCYDCPKFSNPGDNPYFQKHLKAAKHIRAQHFMQNGEADQWRKTADL